MKEVIYHWKSSDIKWTIRDCYDQLHFTKFSDEMDKFFESYKLPKLSEEEPYNLDSFISIKAMELKGLPWWLSGKEPTCQCGRLGFDPWSGKIPHAATKQLSQLLNLWSEEPESHSCWTHVLQLLTPMQPTPSSTAREAATVRSTHAITREQPLLAAIREKPVQQQKSSTAKNKEVNKIIKKNRNWICS